MHLRNVCSSVVSLCTRSNTVPLNRPCTVLTCVSPVCANICSSDDTLFYPLQTGMVVLRATALVERCLLISFTVCVLRAFVTLSCGLHTIHSNGMTLLIYPSPSPPLPPWVPNMYMCTQTCTYKCRFRLWIRVFHSLVYRKEAI